MADLLERSPAQATVPKSRLVDRMRPIAVTVLGLLFLSSVLSVNTFPWVTNDGVIYLRHARDLADQGLVVDGYRQAGYPALLAVVRTAARMVDADPLLATVVLQRALLVGAAVLAFRRWRWWALPLVVFLLVPTTVAYTNFLLTESIAMPGAVLVMIGFVTYLEELDMPRPGRGRRLWLWGSLVVAGAFLLLTIRFTYAVFGVVPLAMAVAARRTPYRGLGVGLAVAYTSLAVLFAVGLSLENAEERGVFLPSTGSEATRYYHAWYRVFLDHPENRADPGLARFFDEGEVHDFDREVTARGVDHQQRVELFETEIADMLEAAGVSELGSRVESVVWSLVGGRFHDLSVATANVIESTRSTVDRVMSSNFMGASRGLQGFADALNDGRVPGVVITDPIGTFPADPDTQGLARALTPISIIVLLVGLRREDLRWAGIAGLFIVLATAVGMGWIRADSFRFLVVGAAAGLTLATFVGFRLAHARASVVEAPNPMGRSRTTPGAMSG